MVLNCSDLFDKIEFRNSKLLFNDKDGSAGILPDKINLTIDPETFSVNMKMPTNYTHSFGLLSQQMIAEMQKILNFNFKKQTSLPSNKNSDFGSAVPDNTDNKNDIESVPKEILAELKRRIYGNTARRNEKIIFSLLNSKSKYTEQSKIMSAIGTDRIRISEEIIKLKKEGWVSVKNIIDERGQRNIVCLNIEKIIKEGLPLREKSVEEKIEELLDNNHGKIPQKDIGTIIGKRQVDVQRVLALMEKKGKITKVLINKKEKLIVAVTKLKEPDFEEAPEEKIITPVIVFGDGRRVDITEYEKDNAPTELPIKNDVNIDKQWPEEKHRDAPPEVIALELARMMEKIDKDIPNAPAKKSTRDGKIYSVLMAHLADEFSVESLLLFAEKYRRQDNDAMIGVVARSLPVMLREKEEELLRKEQKAGIKPPINSEKVVLFGTKKKIKAVLEASGGTLTKPEISEKTGIHQSNLVGPLRKMKELGIISIDENERTHKVSIVKEAREIIKFAADSVEESDLEQESIPIEKGNCPDAVTAHNDISKAELTELLFHISSIKSDELIKEAEKTIKEKEANPAAIAWKYLLEKMKAIINNPTHRLAGSGIMYPLNDDALVPIVENILEVLKPKDSPGFDDNKPLAIEDAQEIDNRINKLNNKQNIDPSERIIRAVYCCHDERGMPYDQVRTESGLQNFNGNYDEIMNRLVEIGWVSVWNSGNGKAVSINPGNVRRILGVSRAYTMAEKIHHFLIEKRNDSSRVKKSDLIDLVVGIIEYIEKMKGVARAATGSDLEEQFKRKISEEQITEAYDAYLKDGGLKKIIIEKNAGDYLISLT